jgi:hypothetical protein
VNSVLKIHELQNCCLSKTSLRVLLSDKIVTSSSGSYYILFSVYNGNQNDITRDFVELTIHFFHEVDGCSAGTDQDSPHPQRWFRQPVTPHPWFMKCKHFQYWIVINPFSYGCWACWCLPTCYYINCQSHDLTGWILLRVGADPLKVAGCYYHVHKCHFSNRCHSGAENCAREYAVVHLFYGLFTIIVSALSSESILSNGWISKHRLMKHEKSRYTANISSLPFIFFLFPLKIW